MNHNFLVLISYISACLVYDWSSPDRTLVLSLPRTSFTLRLLLIFQVTRVHYFMLLLLLLLVLVMYSTTARMTSTMTIASPNITLLQVVTTPSLQPWCNRLIQGMARLTSVSPPVYADLLGP